MVYTSNHKNFNGSIYNVIAISGNRGKDAGFTGAYYPKLAPKKDFWTTWHDNIGKTGEEENNKYYIEQYYKQVLANLNPEDVYLDVDGRVLLCYENSDEFCHRHIVASWFELFLDIEVLEVNNKFEVLDRPSYIKDYLEQVIKENKNMHGFNSIRASFLSEKADTLDHKADKLKNNSGVIASNFRQAAVYYRSEADKIEDYYNESKKVKVKKDNSNN